jgi:hypothetical protein
VRHIAALAKSNFAPHPQASAFPQGNCDWRNQQQIEPNKQRCDDELVSDVYLVVID